LILIVSSFDWRPYVQISISVAPISVALCPKAKSGIADTVGC